MSFSNDVKREIIENKPFRLRLKKEQAYGLFLYARSFTSRSVVYRTESAEIVELYAWFLQNLAGKRARIEVSERTVRSKLLYEVRLPDKQDRDKLLASLGHTDEVVNRSLLETPEQRQVFLSGAWLACGNITDPQKSYHMEFVCRTPELCGLLREVLDSCIPGARHTTRRGLDILYFKECASIEDLLTLMGASKSSLAMIEVEIIKNVRNQANRATNCETANIDKLVSASSAQTEDIRLILRTKGADWLPENLRQLAYLRLENPELSLRELAELSPAPISRSGVHHRLEKLSRLAQTLRGAQGGES